MNDDAAWGAPALDLPRYLHRIGLQAPPAPDLAGLSTLVRAHALTLPWENFDAVRASRASSRSTPCSAA